MIKYADNNDWKFAAYPFQKLVENPPWGPQPLKMDYWFCTNCGKFYPKKPVLRCSKCKGKKFKRMDVGDYNDYI